jgi:hypothetical protein
MTPSKKQEIEVIVDQAIEALIFEIFDGNLSNEEEVEYGLRILKHKIDNLDASDFDHLIDY